MLVGKKRKKWLPYPLPYPNLYPYPNPYPYSNPYLTSTLTPIGAGAGCLTPTPIGVRVEVR